jgi:BlaI family penicillinase repressor
MNEQTYSLTKAEEQIMQVLWRLERAFLKDILDALPEPKPHSNTVATILKILMEKGFVGIQVYGRMHEYHPLIAKELYAKRTVSSVVDRYFEGSFQDAVSFMVKQKEISVEDLELLLKTLKKKNS